MSTRHPSNNHPGPGSTPPSADAPEPASGNRPEAGLPAERLAYSVEEAARLTGLSRDLLYDEMRRGNLHYLKIGRRRLITRQHLEQFLGITPGPRPSAVGSPPSDAKAAADAP
jgi:excisionase family DNA binding protein